MWIWTLSSLRWKAAYQHRCSSGILYQRAGVREYWIVSPNEKAVQVFLLDGGLMQPHEVYGKAQ
ncbi:Uma2 family endonuclease [Flavonifractor plautii]|uniref:Uma2 family endonuclease n=1 Tax=Flavonifractor plautii TaxID=292800 RepID=UPI003520FC4F